MSQVITGMLNTQIAGGRSPASRAGDLPGQRSTGAGIRQGRDGGAAQSESRRGWTAAFSGCNGRARMYRRDMRAALGGSVLARPSTMRPDSCRPACPLGCYRGWRCFGYRERMKRSVTRACPFRAVRAYAKGCSGETFVCLLADDARRIVDVA